MQIRTSAVALMCTLSTIGCSVLAHPPHEHGMAYAAKEAVRLPLAIVTLGILAVYFENSDDELAWRIDQEAVARGEMTSQQAEQRHLSRRGGTEFKQAERGRVIGGIVAGSAQRAPAYNCTTNAGVTTCYPY